LYSDEVPIADLPQPSCSLLAETFVDPEAIIEPEPIVEPDITMLVKLFISNY